MISRSLLCLSMSLIISLSTPSFGQNVTAIHIRFKSKVGGDCSEIWKRLKTGISLYPSLQSFGGSMLAGAQPCSGYKIIYGDGGDTSAFAESLETIRDHYSLDIKEITSTRINGGFEDKGTGNDFSYEFDTAFTSFAELLDFWNTFRHSNSSKELPNFMRNVFNATEYANRLDRYFESGACLTAFQMNWSIFDSITGEQLAKRRTSLGTICSP